MKFKCKISDLETICRLISSKGKNIEGKDYRAILDCLINAIGGQLVVKAMDIQGTFAVRLNYKSVTIEEEGPLPIGDIENFEKFLSRFNSADDVTVSTTENKIIIHRETPLKIARIPKASIDVISSKEAMPIEKLEETPAGFPKTPKMHYNLSMIINADKIKSIFEDGNVIKQRILPWRISDGKLHILIGSEQYGEFESEVSLEDMKADSLLPAIFKTATAFGNGLDNIFSNLDGKVKIYLADEVETCPLVVEQATEKYDFLALLAPYVSKE